MTGSSATPCKYIFSEWLAANSCQRMPLSQSVHGLLIHDFRTFIYMSSSTIFDFRGSLLVSKEKYSISYFSYTRSQGIIMNLIKGG